MFLDPNKLIEAKASEVLGAAARGHIGLDHRFLRALLERPDESLPAVIEFAAEDRSQYTVDLDADLIALFRFWKAPEGLPFLIAYIRQVPEDLPDELIETLVEIGEPALEPLLELFHELDETAAGEVLFVLANLGIRDQRILDILVDRLDYDLSDGLFLIGLYGDPAAKTAIEKAAASLSIDDQEQLKEVAQALEALETAQPLNKEDRPFDIWPHYPERAELPIESLDEDERMDLLSHPLASIRAAAAGSFFNRDLSVEERGKLLERAQKDESTEVRSRAWEALTDATEDTQVVQAMLAAMRRPDLPVEERGGLMVGLAPETDRHEVVDAIVALYKIPGGRAKALEAMWRSVNPVFRDYFAKHLDDGDLEVRRAAVWGVGYFGLKTELDKIRKLLDDDNLRSDALFAYALALPADISRGRMKSLLGRIEKDAHGLSEIEEDLVETALDERLMLAGKEPYFSHKSD